MHTPCNNAAYLAKLCAGHEAIQEVKERSYLVLTCAAAVLLVGGTLLYLHLQEEQVISLPPQKDRSAA